MPLLSGHLVVHRSQWQIDADQVGIVVCADTRDRNTGRYMVMWTTVASGSPRFSWHNSLWLTHVTDRTLQELKRRCETCP